jgi:hypothetical protein
LDEDSLVRVSADGKTATTIANGAAGVGLTVDRAGNYIVAARSALLRVTRAGVVTTIATAPNGSEWVAVAEHPGGGLVVADGILHVIWRVSDDGRTVDKFAEYPGSLPRGGSGIGLLRDDSGDFLLLRIGDDNTAHLYLISPAGEVSQIPLTGAVRPSAHFFLPTKDGLTAVSGGPIVPDGSGAFLFLDDEHTRNIFRLTRSGVVTKFAHLDRVSGHFPFGLARNPETGEIVVQALGRLLRASPDGSTFGILYEGPKLHSGTAILAEIQQ